MSSAFLSLPQLFGYAAFACGLITFTRKRDLNFRLWLTVQNLFYCIHFALLGNPAASAGMVLSAARNLISLRTKSIWAAALLLVLNLGVACLTVRLWWHLLPLLGIAVATIAMFRLDGMRLRIGMLIATLLWIANNILSGSIGGTAMECSIALVNGFTIVKMWLADRPCSPAREGNAALKDSDWVDEQTDAS